MLRTIIVLLLGFSFYTANGQEDFNRVELGLGIDSYGGRPNLKMEYQLNNWSSISFRAHLDHDRIPDQIIGVDTIFSRDTFSTYDVYSFVNDNFLRFGVAYRLYTAKKKKYVGSGLFLSIGGSTFLHFGEETKHNSILDFPIVYEWGVGYKIPFGRQLAMEIEFWSEYSRLKSQFGNSIYNNDARFDFRLLYNLGDRKLRKVKIE